MNNQPPPPEYPEGAPVPETAPVPASFDPLGAGISTAPMPSNASSWQPAAPEDAPKKSSLPMILALIAVIFGCILVVGVVTVLTVGGLR